MRSAAAVALALLATSTAGCAARSQPITLDLSQIQHALTLTLAVPSTVPVGAETRLRLLLRNSDARPIEACLGPARRVSLLPEDDTQGNEPIEVSPPVVDRAFCERRFRLAPGAHFEWNESTRVPGIVRGFASLAVDVQIVDPRRCRISDCPDITLTATAPIEVR